MMGPDEAVDKMVTTYLSDPQWETRCAFEVEGRWFEADLIMETPEFQEELDVMGYVGFTFRDHRIDSMDFTDLSDESIAKMKNWLSEIAWDFVGG